LSTPSGVGVGRAIATHPRAWGAVLLLGYVAVRAALETRYKLFDPDEALEMLAAGSLREGKLPYLGSLSHRGPLLTLIYAVPCTLFGPYAYRAVHACAMLLFVLLGAWFQRCVARATTERVGLLALANLLLLATLRVPSEDNWSLNSDFLMGAWTTVAMCTLLGAHTWSLDSASAPARPRLYAGVGVLLALAFLTKQSSVPLWLVPVAYIALVDRSRVIAKLGWLTLGLAAPLLVAVTTYLGAGELRRAWYFFYDYNHDYAAAGFTGGPVTTLGRDAAWFGRSYAELFALACLGALALARGRQPERRASWLLASTWSLLGLVAAMLPGKCWDNYLWVSHAPVALLGALGAESLLDDAPRRVSSRLGRRVWVAAVLAAPWLGTLAQVRKVRVVLATASDVGGIPPPPIPRRELTALIDRFASQDEALYVTGYAPEMYVLAARRPASRHVISNFVEGVYPGRFEAPSRLVPRFFQELRDDLEQSRPRVIVDACALGFLCHPSSALSAALPLLLRDYHVLPEGPPGVFVRND